MVMELPGQMPRLYEIDHVHQLVATESANS